jgi:CubicO group peptidase (beta-lactamase class C family)
MKKIVFTVSFFVSLQLAAQTIRQLDSIVDAFDKANLFHGTVLVSKDGRVLLNKGYGLADAEFNRPNDPDLAFQIGSVTKQFTAVAIMMLHEKGKLSVNDKVSKYFPSLNGADKITIHHLLTHTSGLYNYTNDTAFWLRDAEFSSAPDKMIARFARKPLDFEPGSKFSYSNSGYLLLGYIIEQVSGKTYEQFIRENIFGPLEMSRSGFDFTKAGNKATGYYDNGAAFIKAFIVDSSAAHAAGAIYSTTADLYKWVQAIHSQKLLKPESWKTILTPVKQNYAYGFIVQGTGASKEIWHNGGIHGFLSHVVYFPSINASIILLSNYMQSNLGGLMNTLSAALFDKPYQLPQQKKEMKFPVLVLQQYTGIYQLAPTFAITVTVEGDKLMAQATGQDKFEIFAEKQDLFFYKVVEAKIKFEKNAGGEVSHLILYQNGMELKGLKIK